MSLLNDLSAIYKIKFLKAEKHKSKGYRNLNLKLVTSSFQTYNLIIYKAESDILNTIKIANFAAQLYSNILPVRFPIKTFKGNYIVKINSRYAALYNYLPGNTIEWENWSKDQVKLLGLAMAKIHLHGKGFVAGLKCITPEVQTTAETSLKHIKSYFNSVNVKKAIKEKLKIKGIFLDKLVLPKKRMLSKTILHMDLVRGNILFNESQNQLDLRLNNSILSGIIDWEKTAIGRVEYDLARTLSFLLVDCKHKSPNQLFKYLIFSGYKKRGRSPFSIDYGVLKKLTNFYLFYDFYKFLKHNPYENLKSNNHYIRTVDYLIKLGILESI